MTTLAPIHVIFISFPYSIFLLKENTLLGSQSSENHQVLIENIFKQPDNAKLHLSFASQFAYLPLKHLNDRQPLT